MAKYRADIRIKTSYVFAPEDEPIQVSFGEFTIVLKNAPPSDDGNVIALDACVIGEAPGLKEAAQVLREPLADWLDFLAYITASKYAIEKVWRVMEWEPWMQSREIRATNVFDPHYPPEAALNPVVVRTAAQLSNANLPGYARHAYHCYRNALLQQRMEERFSLFWRTLEVIAEGVKEKTQIPIPCPKCRANLYCANCGCEPLRVPMANQAIVELLGQIGANKPQELFRFMNTARVGITHGRTRANIERDLGAPMARAVQETGAAACRALAYVIPDGTFPGEYSMAGCDCNFAHLELVASAVGVFGPTQNLEYPPEDQLPNLTIESYVTDAQGRRIINSASDASGDATGEH